VVAVAERVRATRSRLAKQALLAAFLREAHPDEISVAVGFLSGVLPPGGLGGAQALLRDVAEPPAAAADLGVRDVDRAFGDMARASGAGVARQRRAVLAGLLARATAEEQDFLRRLIRNELRQGALESLMLDAIAAAASVAPAEVRRAAMYAAHLGDVARAAMTGGSTALGAFGLRLFAPVAPMLAQPADTVAEALGILGRAALEWKVDGARIQVHKAGSAVRIYTRSFNDLTAALPEVVEAVAALPANELILDGEAIVLDPAGHPRPFQVTMRRLGRKSGSEDLRRELPVSPFFFDLLHADGGSLVASPAADRQLALEAAVPAPLRVPRLETADPEEAQAFLASALAAGHEGVMAKSLSAPYEAGNRGAHWLKIKQTRTLDLVVLAAEWGSGRREGRLSNLHLGARDPRTGAFVMLGKTFKGLTDETLEWQTRELLARETGREGNTVHVKPELVVEVAYSDLQASPRYPGGIALRFARVKGYRPDRRATDADTIDTVTALFAGSTAG
jgi:DNA ligase-1